MITFIFFKLLSWMYSFDKATIDACTPIFALISAGEFIFVVGVAGTNFRKIATFIKGLLKK